jgi:hypothetical protein
MDANFGLAVTAISRGGSMSPSQMTTYQRFVERLQCPTRARVIAHIAGNDEDFFWFPGQYREGAIPSSTLAKMLNVQEEPAGEALEGLLGQWLMVEHMELRQWQEIPAPPNPIEVWRVDDKNAIEVTTENGQVAVAITNPCSHDDRGMVSFTSEDAFDLAGNLINMPEGDAYRLHWYEHRGELYMEVTVAGNHEIKLPSRARLVLGNALMLAASKVC